MSRRKRDLEAERRELTAAAQRLLDGTPLRSTSGNLTGTELITESGLRRDVVYGNHKDLIDDFTGRVKSQKSTPVSMTKIADENCALQGENTYLKRQLAQERDAVKEMIKIVSELSLELYQAQSDLAALRALPRVGAPLPQMRSRT